MGRSWVHETQGFIGGTGTPSRTGDGVVGPGVVASRDCPAVWRNAGCGVAVEEGLPGRRTRRPKGPPPSRSQAQAEREAAPATGQDAVERGSRPPPPPPTTEAVPRGRGGRPAPWRGV